MGFFGKLFDKKECSICGGEIGLLGNRKLEDGHCCKECAKKLSPWFDDRRHSTVDQIKQQLAYREENREALALFRPTVAYGERYTLRAELVNGVPTRFVVERTDNYKEENADIINFRDVTSFDIDVNEHDRELKRRNSEGEMVSYNPPRYEYSYDFDAKIVVNHPYFDDIRFRLNKETLNLETIENRSRMGFGRMMGGFDPTLYPEYRQYRKMCDELEELFRAGIQGLPLAGQAPVPVYQAAAAPAYQSAPVSAPAPAPAGPKFCPNCGAPADGGKFCQSCGSRLG